jgi:hypothetical protein
MRDIAVRDTALLIAQMGEPFAPGAIHQIARGAVATGWVTGLVRGVEQVRRAEYRAIKWAVLGGVVGWVVANLAFGVLVLGLGQVVARRYLERPDLSPWARRVMDALSGHSVRAAAGQLAEVARFERDDG